MTNFPNSTSTERKIETITDIMTDVALFLFYLIALPAIIGLVGSAIASSFTDESFVGGEYSRGTFLVLVLSSMFILFSAFANTRKKNIYRVIGIDNISSGLMQILMILIVPELVGSFILWGFGIYWEYASFSYGFQTALSILFSIISIYYLKFFQISSEIQNSQESKGFQVGFNQNQFNYLQEELFIPMIIKIIGSIIAINIWQDFLVINGTLAVFLIILLFIRSFILLKLGNNQNITFDVILHSFQTGIMVSGISLGLFSLYKLEISPFLTTAIIILLIFKLAYGFFGSWLMQFSQKANIPMRWGMVIRINDLITLILFLGSTIFVSLFNNVGVIAVAIVFIIESGIERHFLLTMPKFHSSLFTFNLIFIPFWIAFILLPWPLVGQIIFFTIGLIVVGVVLSRQKLLNPEKYVIWQNIVYTTLFWEIAIQFGIWSEGALTGAFDSIVMNYLFFITIGSLISFYRLYLDHKDLKKPTFGKVIIGHYYLLAFCGWLLFQKFLVFSLDSSIQSYITTPNSMGVLMPSPLMGVLGDLITNFYKILGRIHEFIPLIIKSANGLTAMMSIDIAGLICIGLLWFTLKVHEEGKMINNETTQKNGLVLQLAGLIFITTLIFTILQSFTGFGFACIAITFLLQNRYETQLKLHLLEENTFLKHSQRLFLINLGISLITLIFFGLEILQVNFTSALMLGLIALMIYQNFIPKVREAIQHNVLNLLNAIIITTLAGLFIPSGIYLLETYSAFRVASALEITITVSIFIICSALLLASTQLKKGNYVSELRIVGITFGIQLIMIIDAYIIIVFNLLQAQITYGHLWTNLQANAAFLMDVFFPLFGVWGITAGLRFYNQKKNIARIEHLWQGLNLISWTGGIIACAIVIIMQYANSALAITTGLLIFGLGLIYPIIELQKINLEKQNEFQKVVDRLITIDLFLIIGVIYFIGIEWFHFHILGALILAFSILILFVNAISFFKMHLTEKLRIKFTAALTITNSVLIFSLFLIYIGIPSTDIINPPIGIIIPLISGLHPISLYCLLLLIPMTGITIALIISIEKVLSKEKVMRLLTQIIVSVQILSLIFVFAVIQEMIHWNWFTALNFAVIIFIIQWIKSPWIQKGIPNPLWNKIIALTYSFLGFSIAFSTTNILEQFTNYQMEDQVGITTSVIIIIIFSGLLASISRLKEGKLIGDQTWIKSKFICEFARIFAVYASFLQFLMLIGSSLYTSSLSFQIFIFSLPCLLLLPWVEYNGNTFSAETLKKYQLVWKIEYLAMWGFGTSGLIIAGMMAFEFVPLSIIIGVVCLGFCSIYTLIRCKQMNWISADRLQKIINFILITNLLLIAFAVYFIGSDLLYIPPLLSSILAMGTLIVFINGVPIFQKYMVPKVRIGITSGLVLLISLLFSAQIIHWIMELTQWTVEQIPISVWFAIALIPIVTAVITICVLDNRLIQRDRALLLKQIGEIVSITDCALIGFFGFIATFSPLIAFIIATLIITTLVIVDFLYLGWLTNRKIGILSFSGAFILNALSISIFIASILPVDADIQVALFFYIYSPMVYLVVQFIIAANNYIVKHTSDKNPAKAIKYSSIQEIPLVPTTKSERLAELIRHQENQIKLSFICISLLLTLYLNIRFITVESSLLAISLMSFLCIILGSISKMQRQNLYYFAHLAPTFLNLGILLLEFSIKTTSINSELIITVPILELVLLIGLISMMTSAAPNTPLLKIVSNIITLSSYFVFLTPIGLSMQYSILITITLFTILTPKSYFNLLFASLFPWTLMYNLGYGIMVLGEISVLTIVSVPIAIGLTLEWLYCIYYQEWHRTLLKKVMGFGAIYIWILTYINLLFEYPVIMQPITPFVLTILLFVLIRLKQFLPNRIRSLNFLIILDVFLLTFTVTAYYLFISMTYRYYLAISLSLAFTGFAFLYVIKQLKMASQKSGIVANLSIGTIFSGIFTFFILIEPTLLNLSFDLAFPIAADLTVLAFFLAIGIYQHGFTRSIWASGWWMWNVVPVVNFTLIARMVSGVDFVTRTLRILNTDIQGSYILSIIICSFMYLPVIIYKIKNYLNQVIYVFWIELLALTLWGAVNLFPDNLSTQITFVILIGLILLAPVFYYFKKWKQLFIIWPMLAVINVVFATILFNLPFIWQAPIDLLIIGLYILVMGYFPYVKEHYPTQRYGIILTGYFSIYLSLFVMLYSFVVLIFIDPIISVNITFIVMSFGLLSGKYVDLNTRIVKLVLAIMSIVNIGILTARTFSLLPNLLIFGIALGIGFSCGSTLAFQARKYIPIGFKDQIRLIMAIGFGAAVFELLRVVFALGIWATLGAFLLTSSLIAFPLLAYRKHTKIILILAAVSMIINEGIYDAPFIAQIPQVLVYLEIFLSALLIYIFTAKQSEWGLTRWINNDLEIFIGLWEIYAVCISTSSIILLNNIPSISTISLLAFFILFIALFNIVSVKCVEHFNLFTENPNTKRIIDTITHAISLILYLDSALLLALNIPVIGMSAILVNNLGYILIYRIGILAVFLCLEFGIIDRYTIKLIKEGLRNEITWITFAIVSLSLFILIVTNFNNGFLGLLIFCLLSFVTIPLIKQAHPQIPVMKLRTINVFLIVFNVMAIFWPILQISENLSILLAGPLALNLTIGVLIVYLFMRFKIIDDHLHHWIYLALSVLIAFTIEEYSRGWFEGSALVNIGLFLLCVTVLNTFNVANSKAAYIYWTVLMFSISTFVNEGILGGTTWYTNNFDAFFYFILIWCSLITLSYILFAERVWGQILNTENIDFGIQEKRILLLGHSNQIVAKKIFVGVAILEIILVSIAVTKAWTFILLNYILNQQIVDPIRPFLLSITLVPLLGLLLFSIILRYIENNRLWFDSDTRITQFLKIRNTIGLVIYGLIPSFLTLNIHYLIFNQIALQYGILTDILAFTGIGLVCLNLIDLHYLHLVNKNIIFQITTYGILIMGISFGILFVFLTNNFLWGCIVFSIFSYLLHFVLPSEQMVKVRNYLNLSLYVEILLQIAIGLFMVWTWYIALFVFIAILHIAIEFELRVSLVPSIRTYIPRIAPWTWLSFSVISSGCVLLGFLPIFTLANLFGGAMLFTMELFYMNWFINNQIPDKYLLIREKLGQSVYIELIILMVSILGPVAVNLTGFSTTETALFRGLLSTCILIIAVILLNIDKNFFQFVQEKPRTKFNQVLYYATASIIGLDAGLLVYLPFEMTNAALNHLGFSVSCLIATGILFIAIKLFYNNRLFNQVAYLFFGTQVVILAYLLGATTGLISTLLIAVLLYPFIFFLEQIELLIKKVIDWIIFFATHIWQAIVNVFIAIKNWIILKQRIIVFLFSLGVAITAGFFSRNIFVGTLLFLILMWNYSPERVEEFTTKNFRNKIMYRGALYFSLMGSFLSYIPLMSWVVALTILLFLGYIIWVVRTSEQLYRLSIYWRFFSALFAIIDFVVMIVMIL